MIKADRFAELEMRVGTVVSARPLENARNPAIVLRIDFGTLGHLDSSAQLTERYDCADLIGRQIVAVTNLRPRQIGSVMSRCLVLGVEADGGTALVSVDATVPNGARVH